VNIHHYYRILVEKSRHLIKKLGDLVVKLGQHIKKLRYLPKKLGHQVRNQGYFIKKLKYRAEELKYFGRKAKYLIRKLEYLAEKLKHLAGSKKGRRLIDGFLIAAAVVVLVFIIANRVTRTIEEAKRVDLSISSQYRDFFGNDTVNALIREFEEKNPGRRIQEAAPDEQADIVFFDDGGFNGMASNSYLHVETLVSFMDLFFYNIDILKAVNLDRPPKTRAEFLAAARAVAKNDTEPPPQEKVFSFALGLNPADTMALRRDFYPWVWANGGNIPPLGTSEENATLPRAHTDIIAFFEQLNREELLAPGSFEKTGKQRLEEFAEGKIAMIAASARDIPFVLQNIDGITFGITTIPSASQGKTRLGLLNIYAGINSACTVPDEARLCLSFFAEKSQVLAESLGAVPGSFPIAFPGEYITEDSLYSKAWDIFEAADIVGYKPNRLFEAEIDRIIREKLAEALE
jgi:ABC-type glycerol-3-phosphate transport system substrate-binding protein